MRLRKRNIMNKFCFVNLVIAIGMSKLLNFKGSETLEEKSTPIYCEIGDFKEEESFYVSDLDVISESDALGNIQYYFVEHTYESIELNPLQINDWKYHSITQSDLYFENTLPVIDDIGYFWIPDVEKAISVLSAETFLSVNHYDTTKEYTKEELEGIENTMNSFNYNPYLWVEDMTFSISNLMLVGDEETFSIYDKDFGVQVEEMYQKNGKEEKRNVVYFYNLLNFKEALKCNYGLSLEEEQIKRSQYDYSYLDHLYIEKETSLYNNVFAQETSQFFIYDIESFLNNAQKERGYLYYYELEEIMRELNKEEAPIRMLTQNDNFSKKLG